MQWDEQVVEVYVVKISDWYYPDEWNIIFTTSSEAEARNCVGELHACFRIQTDGRSLVDEVAMAEFSRKYRTKRYGAMPNQISIYKLTLSTMEWKKLLPCSSG